MRNLALWDPRAGSPADVVRDLVALQSQEHRYARWSVAQRASRPLTAADVDAAFDRGDVLRTHVLRPTWHYVSPGELRWLLELSGPLVEARMARRHDELQLDAATRARAVDVIAAAVADGPLTRHEVADELESNRVTTSGQRLPHLLMLAELRRAICSGPMRGRQHTYAAFDDRVPPSPPRSRTEALEELARRYFSTRGPATAKDFRWWAGLGAADARVGIDEAELESDEVEGRTYFSRGGSPLRRRRKADLVQCFDESVVSYTESRDLLSPHRTVLGAGRSDTGFQHFVLLDGVVVGRWRERKDRSVELRLDGPLDASGERSVTAAVADYERFVGALPPT
jgi:hypothetical protein